MLRAIRQGENQRDQAIIQMMLDTGLRISETAALKVSDIELNDRSVWVSVKTGKGMKPRSMPPNVRVRKALESYMKMRTDECEEDLLLAR